MGQPATKIDHPYLTRVRGVCGGKPIIAGTRVPVWVIVGYHFNLKYSIDQIIEIIPHISHAQVYDMLSYYYDHKDEIDEQLKLNTDEEYWKKNYPYDKYETTK
ncbi:MAG: DUF433 domain-containing protein [bacterium]